MNITIELDIIGPYVRDDGKLVVRFTMLDQFFEREVDYSDEKKRWIFTDPDKLSNGSTV